MSSEQPSFTVPKDRVTEFIRSASAPNRPAAHRCFFFSLVHEGERGKEPVCVDSLSESLSGLDKLGPQEVDSGARRIAERFVNEAQEMADMFTRPQLFVVAASISASPDVAPCDQSMFRIEPHRRPESGFSDTEAATPKGELAMAMRWLEVQSKSIERMTADARTDAQKTADRSMSLLDVVMRRNEFLESQMVAMTANLQEAMDKRSERDVNAHAKMVETNREERWWQMAEQMAGREIPKLLDKWGAGPMGAFIRSFKADELRMFISALPKDKQALILEALDIHLGMNMLQMPMQTVAADHQPLNGTTKKEAS